LVHPSGLPELLPSYLEVLEAGFPEAEIKGGLLTQDHQDHYEAIQYFVVNDIPVSANIDEINSPFGEYDISLFMFPAIILIEPGDSVTLGDGAIITAVDLQAVWVTHAIKTT
jgi:hypothetical protein